MRWSRKIVARCFVRLDVTRAKVGLVLTAVTVLRRARSVAGDDRWCI
jgi:hypothetical protein